MKSCYWVVVAAALLVVALVATVKWLVLPRVADYQAEIVSRVAAASGMDVSAKSIRGRWTGFRPYLDMEEVVFREPAGAARRDAGTEALRLPSVSASLSWWALALGQLRFGEIVIDSPALALSRRADGLIYFAGRALNESKPAEDDGRFLQWLLEQEGLVVRDATLTWNDALTPGHELAFANTGIAIHRRRGGHEFGLSARPLTPVARTIELRGAVRFFNADGKWQAAGGLYTSVEGARLNDIRQHVSVPDSLIAGSGNLRAWIDIDTAAPVQAVPNAAMRGSTPLRSIVADLRLIGTKVRLADDLAPLDIAELSGRLEYRASDAGFTMASKGLAFRTVDGVRLAPADFSLTLADQNDPARMSGEMSGHGIDLKVMTALVEYFPVGKDVRRIVAEFAPRGSIEHTRFAWKGPLEAPERFTVKGRLKEFSIQRRGDAPAVAGLSGELDGDERGGRFQIASAALALELPTLYEAPLVFDRVGAKGAWKIDNDRIDVEVDTLAVANADLAAEFKGTYWRFRAGGSRASEEKGPGFVDLTGRLARMRVAALGGFLPRSLPDTRAYLAWALREGEVRDADLTLRGSVYDFPFRKGEGGQFRIAGRLSDVVLRHGEGWPQISAIGGEVLWENTRFEAKVTGAQVFATRLGATTVAIDDVAAHPPMLTIQGSASARAEEAARYLRESPLLHSIGGFTRTVTLEGPGKLELKLALPLGDPAQHKVPVRFSGSYALNRGRARVAIGEKKVDITGLNGSVSFNEALARSQSITGMAFGQPVTAQLATNPEGGITTEFAGRATLAALGELLPFRLPQQVSGTIDYGGKVVGRARGVDIQFGSNLLGAVSTLPFPLAKRADEPRAIEVGFIDAGLPTERIRVSLAGNGGAAGDAGTGADAPESRIEARFKRRLEGADANGGFFGGLVAAGEPLGNRPVPEGLWLVGKLPRFDFDSWREAVDRFYPAAKTESGAPAPGPGASDSPIAGFDFKFGEMVAYGRPFKALALKGRQAGDDWRMSVESAEASGDFSWRPGSGVDRGYVRARLARFALADEVPGTAAKVAPQAEADKTELPAFDIVAESFVFKERFLGRLEFKATPQGANWKIDQLDITNGHAKLLADGLYQRYGDPTKADGRAQTSMNFKLETSNLNALFDQFGFAEQMKGGRGTVEGRLTWPGHAFQFSFPTVSGQMKIAARDGRFAKIEPGAGKLLGLLSLQSLPNRLTLDFRDLYDDGLAYRAVDADVGIVNGLMQTGNFEIKGLAARIRLEGTVSLTTERVNLNARIEPQLGEGAAIGAGVLLTPIAGAAVYVASRLFEKVLQYDLVITGTWDNPDVVDVKKKENPQAAAKTANATAAAQGKPSP